MGVRDVPGTNTITAISKSSILKDEKVKYGKTVCALKPNKLIKAITRLTVGGNLLDFTGNLSTPTASDATVNFVFDSVISTPGAKCLTADIQHVYLNNELPDPEYMRLPISIIPQDFIGTYDLQSLVDDQGWVYFGIDKSMYGLKQADVIANEALVTHMAPFGISPSQAYTRVMGTRHNTNHIQSCS